jgi:ribosomal protein L11 methyltransferase
LVVDGELAEAVSEVLGRYVTGGVAIESTQVVADAEDEGHAVGPLRVAGYLPVDEQLEERRRQLEEALWYLGRIRPLPEARFEQIQNADWSEAWKQHYRPIAIGRRLMIVPAWLEEPEATAGAARLPLRMDPGMAFGTGTHPTTQLCLELIEGMYQDDRRLRTADRDPASAVGGPPSAVIDVGTGSGILAIAALKLGAAQALGVDIDPLAMDAARHNAALNGVTGRLELGLGSVSEILGGKFSIRSAPLVLANILAPVLVRLFAEDGLGELVTPGGAAVLSGILEDQADKVIAAAEAQGLALVDRRQAGDWVALLVAGRRMNADR